MPLDIFTPGPRVSFSLPLQALRANTSSLLTIEEAADYLGMSAKWLYRNYRDLPHVLIGSGQKPRIRFSESDLESWVTGRTIDWRKA
jgi:predicted DNA-binding transcriptional regulator AlpA